MSAIELPTPIFQRPDLSDMHHTAASKRVARTVSSASSVWSEEDDILAVSPSNDHKVTELPTENECPAEEEFCASQALDIFLRSTADGAVQLFPALKLSHSIDDLTSLPELNASTAVKQLKALLYNALGQQPRIGYNPGTDELSITVSLAAEDDYDVYAIPADSDGDTEAARAVVIQTMLALFSEQTEIEQLWKTQTTRRDNSLLANRCLVLFAAQTGVGIIDRRINLVNQTLRLTVASAANQVSGRVDGIHFTDDHRELFQYHASYFLLTGCEHIEGECHYSEAARQAQHEAFTTMLLDEIWQDVNRKHYFPTDELKELATGMLWTYLHSAVDARRLSATFTPSKPLRLYLHGSAGVGKSSFTSTIAASLQIILQKFITPTRRVDLVKCPLNAVTPDNLRAMLHVQGISDWSIERVLEQTLRRGDVATFHLEEAPEDPALQAELIRLIDGMVVSLLSKYPNARGNLIFVAVSNYAPAPAVAETYTALQMAPPDQAWQVAWCEDMLRHSLEEGTQAKIAIALEAPPVYSPDMRPLEIWRGCVAFHISENIKRRVAPSDRSRTAATVLIRFAPHHFASERNLRVTVGLALHSTHRNVEVSPAITEAFTLTSQDGFFYHDERSVAPRGEAASQLSALGVQPMHRADVTTIVGMLSAEYVAPAVFVLTGSAAAQRRTAAALGSYIRHECDADLAEQEVAITCMEDKSVIFGKPSDVRGGLCKFIDDVTNPAEVAAAGRRRFALITATANEEGQYILREMLESNTSRTHRHVARKGRTAFIVMVPEGCEVRPETRSRAHAVLHCEEPCAFAA